MKLHKFVLRGDQKVSQDLLSITPSKTQRWGLVEKSCGSQLIRDERVRMFRVIPAVLVSERNDEIAISRTIALTKAGRDSGFDTIYDLGVKRHVVV